MIQADTLKPGWSWEKFGDVVRLSKDRAANPEVEGIERYVGLEHIDPDDLRIRRWGLVAEGITFTSRFKPGQVLFGKRRAYQRKVAVADFEGVCSGDIYVFESANPKVLLPELLPFICQTDRFFDHAVGTSAGSLSPRTNWTSLANFEFALPPLEEQRRISETLNAVEDTTEAIQSAQFRLDTVITSTLENVLQNINEQATLDQVLTDTSYGCSQKSSYEPTGVPILRIPNVLRGELDLADLQWINLSDEDVNRYTVKDGDILLVRSNGNPDYVGRCVVVKAPIKAMVYASYLIRLRVNSKKVIPEFIAAVLNSPSIRRKLRGDVRSSAGNFNINTQGIKRQKIPLPTIENQTYLVNCLKQLHTTNVSLDSRISSAVALKKNILDSLGD